MLLALAVITQALGAYLDSAASWTCSTLGDMPCRSIDERRKDMGCQVECHNKASGPGCQRAKLKCASWPGCLTFTVNHEGTVATLKRSVLRRGVSPTAPPARADAAARADTVARADMAGALLECGNLDEMPERAGCQLRCVGARCVRAEKFCRQLPRCGGLQRYVSAQGGGYADLLRTNATSRADDALEDLQCAPTLRRVEKGGRPACTSAKPLCVIMANSESIKEYSAGLHWSVEASLPVLTAPVDQIPRERQAAVTHLTYIHDHYDALPQVLALLIDHGDAHATSGCSTCVQMTLLREMAADDSKALRRLGAEQPILMSLSPQLERGGGGIKRATYKCVSNPLSPAEEALWNRLLGHWLGPAPKILGGFAGSQFLASRSLFRQRPRAMWATLLRTLLRRKPLKLDNATSDESLLVGLLEKGLWGVLLGESVDGSFVCHPLGYGAHSAQLPIRPPSDRRVAEAVQLQLEAKAPLVPNPSELATGCSSDSDACVVVVDGKASDRRMAYSGASQRVAILRYKRQASALLSVTPNLWHEHAVYLHYISAFYDSLPPLTAFVHGHYRSWHNRLRAPAIVQLSQMDLATIGAKGDTYYSFNDLQQCMKPREEDWQKEMNSMRPSYERMLEQALGPPPERLCHAYCCTQFLVSRDRIRRHSHQFYRELLADLLDEQVPIACKISGHFLEYTWGFLLGEPANFTCRGDGWGYKGPRT